MSQKPRSRSERRMEKKQALILLCLVLAVSLVSFSLGVMVGRGGAAKQVAGSSGPTAAARPVAPVAAPPVLPSPAASAETEPVKVDAPPTVKAGESPAEPLTFYETLPRGDLPLGSGINLPPAATLPKSTEPAATTVNLAPAVPPVTASQPRPATAQLKISTSSPPPATGGYVVQLASFKDAAAAGKLQRQLDGKGYHNLFVEAADLGSKGVWHRVFAGPYSERSAAEQLAGQLRQQEKISPLVRKR